MEVADLHIGSQLKVASNAPAGVPGLQDLVYGVGPTMVPGTAWIESGLLVGSPQTYPVPNAVEATLMVARAPVTNPKAVVAPSIFKVSSKLNVPPTPIDVMFGDPIVGQVGVTFNTAMINILNSTVINIITPTKSEASTKSHVGAEAQTGAEVRAGVQAQAGAEVRAAAKVDNGPRLTNGPTSVNGPVTAPIFFGNISACSGKKNFDISHPTKDNHRLRHVCIEGPTADVYFRGRLKDNNIIELPEYWNGLVDPDSITVQLQPIGDRHFHLNVMEMDSQRIIVKESDDKPIDCFYHVYGERNDVEKNIAEYEGLTPADYPGDNSNSIVNGV